MVSLQVMDLDDTWPDRPKDWAPVAVDRFDVDEWDRAVDHFRDHWLESITKTRPQNSSKFCKIASSYRDTPYAISLDNLRNLAEVYLR
jgi:hypothetical protein